MRLFSIILLVGLAATNVNANSDAPYLNLKSDLKAGSHSVGFKLVKYNRQSLIRNKYNRQSLIRIKKNKISQKIKSLPQLQEE